MIKRGLLFSLLTCLVNVLNAQADSVLTGAARIQFVKVPAGKFTYGRFDPPTPSKNSSDKEYKGYREEDYALAKQLAEKDFRPGFNVTITRDFYISRFEVTQGIWKEVMKTNPSFFRGDSLPVENVSWSDAVSFTKRLNELDPSHNYRLPTEFEWEYAARAGADDDISWDEIRKQAQLGTKSTQHVGTKMPKAWGIYDMSGNVWEWVSDVYNEKIFADSIPVAKGNTHVLKGASFTGDVKNATYMTHAGGPGNGWDVGFRVVMEEKGINHGTTATSGFPRSKKRSPVRGWHLSRTSHQGAVPEVTYENGIITLRQNPFGQGGVLLTNKKYRNFELSVDVKVDSFCNGGIFLRSTESGQAYQVELSEPGGTGSLFGEMLGLSRHASATGKDSVWKANDWNHFRIRMTGDTPRVILWINGVQMYDVTQPGNDFITGATEGMIGLQVHWSATYSAAAKAFDMSSSWRPNGKHQFRNLRIRKIKNR